MDDETKNVSLDIHDIIPVIINCVACPPTVVLNVLVIMAVKRRPRLQSNANILLACLAVTDALTGLLVQPSFILYIILQFLGKPNTFFKYYSFIIPFSSVLHLFLVTCERLIAIKFTVFYPYLVTTRNIKVAVMTCWVVPLICALLLQIQTTKQISYAIISLAVISDIVFIVVCYVILYFETLRHQKKIITEQLLQEEVERFVKESRALKTTVYVVGAVVLCHLPVAILLFANAIGVKNFLPSPWARTYSLLNSLLNPLIYCWRQREMRQFVFRIKSPAVAAIN